MWKRCEQPQGVEVHRFLYYFLEISRSVLSIITGFYSISIFFVQDSIVPINLFELWKILQISFLWTNECNLYLLTERSVKHFTAFIEFVYLPK